MRYNIYPSIFTYEPNKEISVYFPDLEVATSGEDETDARCSAEELLQCVLAGLQEDRKDFPPPTPVEEIEKGLKPNERVVCVTDCVEEPYVMNIIDIHKNPNGDIRTAPKDVTLEQFREANQMHRDDVMNVMDELSCMLKTQGEDHDWTKVSFEDKLYQDFMSSLKGEMSFASGVWYKVHVATESHHPLSYCHDDITLLDIIEMVVDCVCAAKTRGVLTELREVDTAILMKALQNTVSLVDKMTIVK